MSPKSGIGLYICGCDGKVSDALDTRKLVDDLAKDKRIKLSREHECLCQGDGLIMLQEDLQQGLVDRIVVAGCTPGRCDEVFRSALRQASLNEYMLERCNIREQCVWAHKDELPEKLYKKAMTLIKMSLTRLEFWNL